jgi:hypothetical protein
MHLKETEMKIRKSIQLMTKKRLQQTLEYFVKEHDKLINIIYDLHHEFYKNDRKGI